MKVKILYFSGTGNTHWIGQQLLQAMESLGANGEIVSMDKILENPKEILDLLECDILGVGFPVYDLSPPSILGETLNRFPKLKKPKAAFIYSTQGFIAGDALAQATMVLKDKNLWTLARESFDCPANGVVMYEKKDHRRYRNVRFDRSIPSKLIRFSQYIQEGYRDFQERPFCLKALMNPFLNWIRFFSHKWYGEKYYLDLTLSQDCNRCQKCVGLCPQKNLVFHRGKTKILRQNGCLRCLRCIVSCPKKAISFQSSPLMEIYNETKREDLWKRMLGQS